MKQFLLILFLGIVITINAKLRSYPHLYKKNGVTRNNDIHPLSDDMIQHINGLKPLWKAGRNFPQNASMEHIRNLMGALTEPQHIRLPEREPHSIQGLHIPKEFDSRTKWPNCPSIKEIRDQGSCGSCWAFAATETMTDRYCVATKGKQFRFSADNLISCCGILHFCGFGCWGGFPSMAWRYWKKTGLVSGGPYGSNEGCQPYEIPPCEHHPPKNESQVSDGRPDCSGMAATPKCHKQCEASYSVSYDDDLHKGKETYSLSRHVDQIQVEIMKNGPVVGTFFVYDDFLSYKSGIYHYTTGDLIGGHAIKIVGWGEEDNVPYWIVANSWNYDWGDGGFFKILRGKNECKIENSITAGIPDV